MAALTGTSVKYVCIPCDGDAPLRELVLEIPPPKAGSAAAANAHRRVDWLLAACKPHFSGGSVDPRQVERQYKQQLSQYMDTSGVGAGLDMSMFETGKVETFPLTRGREAAVTLYLDEVGVLKNLPRNVRATSLAGHCGHANTPLHGDIYVGRTTTAADGARTHVDFTLADVDSGAAWCKDAARATFEAQQAQAAMHAQMGDQFQRINVGEDAAGGGTGEGGKGGVHGGHGDGYTWTQTREELEIAVPVPAGTRARDVKVTFGVKRCKVALKGLKDGAPVVDGALSAKVRPDECTWTLQDAADGDGRVLAVTLDKLSPRVWTRLLGTKEAAAK